MNQLLPNPITFSDLSAPPSTGLWIPDVPKLDDLGRRVTVLGYNRPAQISAYNALVGPRTLLKSPTGSGKSLIEIACAIRETVESDWRRKTIFFGPQRNIVNQFSGGPLTTGKHPLVEIPGFGCYDWHPLNQCGSADTASVRSLIDFMLSEETNERTKDRNLKIVGTNAMLVSNAALVAAWKHIREKEPLAVRKRIIESTSFRSDECHHIEMGGNKLGEVIKDILQCDGSIHLMTATFLRGNLRRIVDLATHSFLVHRVAWLAHWRTLGLNSMTQTYIPYKDAKDVLEQCVAAYQQEPNEKFITFIPAATHGYFRDKKHKDEWVEECVLRFNSIGGEGMNLIGDAYDENRMEDAQEVDWIVAGMRGKEGMDRPEISRILNTVVDNSVFSSVQKNGRMLRWHPGKTNVKMTNFMPELKSWDSPETRALVASRFNAIAVASMYDNLTCGVMLPAYPKNCAVGSEAVRVELGDIFGEDVLAKLTKEVIERITKLELNGKTTPEAIDLIIESSLEKYADDAMYDIEPRLLHNAMRRMIQRACVRAKTGQMQPEPESNSEMEDVLDLSFIEANWSKIVREEIAGQIVWTSGDLTATDFEQLKNIMDVLHVWQDNFVDVKSIGFLKVWRDHNHPQNNWLYQQHKAYKADTLEPYKRHALESLTGWKGRDFDRASRGLERWQRQQLAAAK